MTELHIVIGRNGFICEQSGNQSFDTVVTDIIGGQYGDAQKVLRIVPPANGWPHGQVIEEVTNQVAWAIYNKCDGDRHWITYGGAAYALVEEYVGIAQARTCLGQQVA